MFSALVFSVRLHLSRSQALAFGVEAPEVSFVWRSEQGLRFRCASEFENP
jgi:hypothetical protein